MRKSSSSTIVSANSSTSAGGLASAATGIRPTRCGASHAIARRSVCTRRPTAGRCTFTTTSSPVCSRAAWTWAIDAAAIARPVERGEHLLERPSELALDGGPHDVERLGRHLVAAALELLDQLGREQALAGRDDLAELDERRAERLGGQPQAARQVGGAGRSLGAAPLASPQPRHHGAGQAGGDDEPATARREPARGDQVRDLLGGEPAQLLGLGPPRDPIAVEHPRRLVAEGAPLEIGWSTHRPPGWRLDGPDRAEIATWPGRCRTVRPMSDGGVGEVLDAPAHAYAAEEPPAHIFGRVVAYKYVVAAVFVSALFLDLLDTTIVNVALRSIGEDFADRGHRVGRARVHAVARGVDPGQRLDGRPLRHQAGVPHRARCCSSPARWRAARRRRSASWSPSGSSRASAAGCSRRSGSPCCSGPSRRSSGPGRRRS